MHATSTTKPTASSIKSIHHAVHVAVARHASSQATNALIDMGRAIPKPWEKQMWVHLLAYNVIRLLMAQAASDAGVDPRTLSFKHTVQLWTEWVSRGMSATKDSGRIFELIIQCRVGNRGGRIEPRMRKRRPKPFPWLKVSRAHARQQVKKYGHDWETK